MQAVKRNYVNEERIVETRGPITKVLEGEFIVHAYSILTTDTVMFDVYESTEGFDAHGTTRYHDDFGRIGAVRTRQPDAEIMALPWGPERTARCQSFWTASQALCEETILAAFPELAGVARCKDGHATCTLDEYHEAIS